MFTVTVTWNGATITGPVTLLIFHDELVRDDRTNVLATPVDGTVICRSENQTQVGWQFADAGLIQVSGRYFKQRRTGFSATPSVSRLTTNTTIGEAQSSEAKYNGLWTCRLNGGLSTAFPVGIYARGEIVLKWEKLWMQQLIIT